MSRSTYTGPKLPKILLDQVGGADKKRRNDVSRKDRRKAERHAKKGGQRIVNGPVRRLDKAIRRQEIDEFDISDEDEHVPPSRAAKKEMLKDAKPLKSILKAAKPVAREPTPETDIVSDGDVEDSDGGELSDPASDDSFTISRQAAKAGLADEDDEIAALERRLGIKGSKKTKEVDDAELDWLVTGDEGSDEEAPSLKRKRPDDAKWLKDKRRKAGGAEVEDDSQDSDDHDAELEDLETPFSEDDELSSDDFAGFDSGDDAPVPPEKRVRENPYIAPVTKTATTEPIASGKYIPPSLRKAASSEEEALKQLRRQMQGQLNRLSDANLLSILQAIEHFYEKHARQHVTSSLIDMLVSLVSNPSTLNDTFIILHAGFAAAVYKVVGTDFGAQLLEKLAESFDFHGVGSGEDGKQQLNLVTFLSNLYTFQVVGSAMLFDYVRLLLNDLSEHNTELLLRIIRTSGTQLRQEDPSALKDIVLLLQRHVTETGEANLSVRTKFMIDTIRDLKNNRNLKTGVAASALASEHTTKMKKILGTLSTRSLRATEPLRVTLADLRESEKKGKWWLVGASYHDPAKLSASNSGSAASRARHDEGDDAGYDSETPGHTNLTKAARAQGMNTDIRRQIFVNIVGADDFRDAELRLRGLKLKTKQLHQEVPRVLLHCVGVEEGFNPFYALLAKKLCEDGKAVTKAFQSGLWETLKAMRNAGDADASDDEGSSTELGLQKIVNLAKFFGFLIADGTLPLTVLKTADFALLRPDTKAFTFAEVVLTTLFVELKKRNKSKFGDIGAGIDQVFEVAGKAPQMIQGLQYFLRTVISKATLASGKKESKAIREGCELALTTLERTAEEAGGEDMSDDSED